MNSELKKNWIYTAPVLLLVIAVAGCSSDKSSLLESSQILLDVDERWTDITTYQDRQSGLLSFGQTSTVTSNFVRNSYIRSRVEELNQIKFDLELTETPAKIAWLKLALLSVYTEELDVIAASEWRPEQNYSNAKEYDRVYGPIGKYGKTLVENYYLGPWLAAQLRRDTVYQRWISWLRDQGVGSSVIEKYKETFDKN
jgi:hypothetical protein